MKKIVNCLAALAIYGVSMAAFAAIPVKNANDASPPNVGVIDMRQVMEKSTQFAQIKEKLEKDFKHKQEELRAKQTVLKNDSDRLRRDTAIMDNKARTDLEQKILGEEQDLRQKQAGFQKQLMEAQNKELKGFMDTVEGAIAKVAVANHLVLVITKDTVAYVNKDLDITNKVIQLLPHK